MASSLILQRYYSHHYHHSTHCFRRRSLSSLLNRCPVPTARAQLPVASFVEKTQTLQKTVSSKQRIHDAEDWVNRKALAPAVEVDPVTVLRNMVSEERERLITVFNVDANTHLLVQTTAPPPPPVLPNAIFSRKPGFPILTALALLVMGTVAFFFNFRRKREIVNNGVRTNIFGKMLQAKGAARGQTRTESIQEKISTEQDREADEKKMMPAKNPTTIRVNAIINDQGHQNGVVKPKKAQQEGMREHQNKHLQNGANGISKSGEGKVLQVVCHTGPSADQEALRLDVNVQSNNTMNNDSCPLVPQEIVVRESVSLPLNNSTITHPSLLHSENNYNVLDSDRRNVLTLEKPGTSFTLRGSEGLLSQDVLESGVSKVMPSTDKFQNRHIGLNAKESHLSNSVFMPEQFTTHKEVSSSLTANEDLKSTPKQQELIHGAGSPIRYPEVSISDAQAHNFSGFVGQTHNIPGQLSPEKESHSLGLLTEEQDSLKNCEMSRRQKLENSLPVLAMGLGTFGVLLGGVSQGLEVVGFAALASLVSSELLWAESRKFLQQELTAIEDRKDLLRFLLKRNILND